MGEKKVVEQVCSDAAQDDVASGRQMSSNGASIHVSPEGEIRSDVTSCISTTTDATLAPSASNSPTQTTDPKNCLSVETVPSHKDNSQTSQEGQHNRNTPNGNQHADDVDMTEHQNKSPVAPIVPTASTSIQSVPAADNLINSHKSATAGANVQTVEKTSGSSESIKLASSQSVPSTNASATTSTSSNLSTGTLVDPKSSLVSLEENEKTSGSSDSTKLAPSQSVPSTKASVTTSLGTSSSLPIGTSVDPKSGLVLKAEENEKTSDSSESIKLASSQSVPITNASATTSLGTSSSLPICNSVDPKSSLVSLEERLATCGLPEAVDDADFDNKLKVFTNYRNFGAMYQSKNNFKKAEWAFKNGIKQAVGCETLRSKEQLRTVIGAELEFRLQRAKALMRLGQQSEAKVECSTVLIIDSSNKEAPSILSSLS